MICEILSQEKFSKKHISPRHQRGKETKAQGDVIIWLT